MLQLLGVEESSHTLSYRFCIVGLTLSRFTRMTCGVLEDISMFFIFLGKETRKEAR